MSEINRAEFDRKRARLIALTESIASVVPKTTYWDAEAVTRTLRAAANALEYSTTIEDKRSAGASIRGLFHKEGFHEFPAPDEYTTWDSDLDELFSLSTIYAESRYAEQNAEQGVDPNA